MKKNTKGAIAIGAAALLLAGGAGTMAAWSDSASLGGGEVTAGSLGITETTAGTWTWATPNGATGAFDPADDKIVPGDVVAYTATYELDVVGTNLQASIEADIEGLDGGLATHLDTETEVTVGETEIEVITAANNGNTVTVTTTITFDPDTSGQDGMGQAADLSGATIILQQTAPAGPAAPVLN